MAAKKDKKNNVETPVAEVEQQEVLNEQPQEEVAETVENTEVTEAPAEVKEAEVVATEEAVSAPAEEAETVPAEEVAPVEETPAETVPEANDAVEAEDPQSAETEARNPKALVIPKPNYGGVARRADRPKRRTLVMPKMQTRGHEFMRNNIAQ